MLGVLLTQLGIRQTDTSAQVGQTKIWNDNSIGWTHIHVPVRGRPESHEFTQDTAFSFGWPIRGLKERVKAWGNQW